MDFADKQSKWRLALTCKLTWSLFAPFLSKYQNNKSIKMFLQRHEEYVDYIIDYGKLIGKITSDEYFGKISSVSVSLLHKRFINEWKNTRQSQYKDEKLSNSFKLIMLLENNSRLDRIDNYELFTDLELLCMYHRLLQDLYSLEDATIYGPVVIFREKLLSTFGADFIKRFAKYIR
jgi:hypothetical protein